MRDAKRRIQFFVPFVPPSITFQDKVIHKTKSGQVVIHDSMQLKTIKAELSGYLAEYVPDTMLHAPIQVLIKWIYPKTKGHKDGEYKVTKPDIDNLQKTLLDQMTRLGFWEDDAGVASIVAEKFWGDIPGLFVRIVEV